MNSIDDCKQPGEDSEMLNEIVENKNAKKNDICSASAPTASFVPKENVVMTGSSAKDLDKNANNYEEELDEDERVQKFSMGEDLFNTLTALGYSENAIKKSISCGCINEQSCVQWLAMHKGHPELDTPLTDNIKVIIRKKVVLTDEEKKAKIEELKNRIALNKLKEKEEEKLNEIKREKERMAMGKAALELREKLAEEAKQRAITEKRKEKEADALAREKIQIKIAIDKLVRKGVDEIVAKAQIMKEFEENRKRQRENIIAINSENVHDIFGKLSSSGNKSSNNGCVGNINNNDENTPDGSNISKKIGSIDIGANNNTMNRSFLCINEAESFEATVADSIPPPSKNGFKILVELMKLEAKKRNLPESLLSETLSTLRIIFSKIVQSPLDFKCRNLRSSTNTFRSKITPVPYALAMLKLAGFTVAFTPCASNNQYNNEIDSSNCEQVLVMNSLILRRVMYALEAL